MLHVPPRWQDDAAPSSAPPSSTCLPGTATRPTRSPPPPGSCCARWKPSRTAGDLDAAGLEIINGYREAGLAVASILMDLQTFRRFQQFGTASDARGNPL